jgi:ABC-type proline/glycine betaine transport system ATPase subunit
VPVPVPVPISVSCDVNTCSLDTIIDYSRVLVMENGKVAEIDTPYALLSNPESLFGQMISQAGEANKERLKEIAYQALESSKNNKMSMEILKMAREASNPSTSATARRRRVSVSENQRADADKNTTTTEAKDPNNP